MRKILTVTPVNLDNSRVTCPFPERKVDYVRIFQPNPISNLDLDLDLDFACPGPCGELHSPLLPQRRRGPSPGQDLPGDNTRHVNVHSHFCEVFLEPFMPNSLRVTKFPSGIFVPGVLWGVHSLGDLS